MGANNQEACALVWRHWQAGEVMQDFPPELKPATRTAGYAVQAGLEGYSTAPRAGWKIAGTNVAGQRHINIPGPIAGRLLAERLYGDGATLSLAGNRMRVAEPEFAFRLGRDLPPRASAYEADEVVTAVGELHLAIELPDSRFADFTRVGEAALIADCACARDLVVGPAVTANWRALDLATHRVLARVGDRYEREGTGGNVLGDPRLALTWLVNELSGLGITIRAGELVTTGTATVPLEIRPGDRVEADFGALGSISVALE